MDKKIVKKMGNVDDTIRSKDKYSEKEIKSMITDGKILSRIVVQIAGSPQSHIDKTMEKVAEIFSEKYDVQNKIIYPAKKDKEMFVTFAEFEIIGDIVDLTDICFEYMPSSIEIIEPRDMISKASDITAFFNDILARLHQTDLELKNKTAENKILNKNCESLFKNIVLMSLKNGSTTKQEIMKDTGVEESAIDQLINGMIKEGLIAEKDGKIVSLLKK